MEDWESDSDFEQAAPTSKRQRSIGPADDLPLTARKALLKAATAKENARPGGPPALGRAVPPLARQPQPVQAGSSGGLQQRAVSGSVPSKPAKKQTTLKLAAKPALKPAPRSARQPAPPANSDSDGGDFVAGTLRQAPIAQQPPDATPDTAKPRRPAGRGRRRVARQGGTVTLLSGRGDELDAAGAAEPDLRTVRLGGGNMPGWSRAVAPYQPSLAAAAAPPPPPAGSSVQVAHSVGSIDWAALGSGSYQCVLINAELLDAAARSDAGGGWSPNRSAGAALQPGTEPPPEEHALSVEQLAALPVRRLLRGDALVCVWASKARVADVARCMARWGARFVESLTWVWTGPDGHVVQARSAFVRQSHSTLLMGRTEQQRSGGGPELQLRHQRSPDVIFEPCEAGGRVPEAAYLTLETLLPGAWAAVESPPAPELLELDLRGSSCAARAGWARVAVQRPGGMP